jgi:hypothetical protein
MRNRPPGGVLQRRASLWTIGRPSAEASYVPFGLVASHSRLCLHEVGHTLASDPEEGTDAIHRHPFGVQRERLRSLKAPRRLHQVAEAFSRSFDDQWGLFVRNDYRIRNALCSLAADQLCPPSNLTSLASYVLEDSQEIVDSRLHGIIRAVVLASLFHKTAQYRSLTGHWPSRVFSQGVLPQVIPRV